MPWSINTLHTFDSNSPRANGIVAPPAEFYSTIFIACQGGTPTTNVLEEMDYTTGAIVNDEPVTFGAVTVLFDFGLGFFTTEGGAGPSQNKAARYDTSGFLLSEETVGQNPLGQCDTISNYLCANTGSDSVTVLDKTTGAFIKTISGLTGGPTSGIGVILNPDNVNAWVPTINNILYQIDLTSLTLIATHTVTQVGRWAGMCVSGGFMWASDSFNGAIVKLDFAGNVVGVFPVDTAGSIVADRDGHLWIASTFVGGAVVSAYDTTGHLLASAALALPNTGFGICQGAEDDLDGNSVVWATSFQAGGLTPAKVQKFQLVFTPPSPGTSAFPGTFTGFGIPGQFWGGNN